MNKIKNQHNNVNFNYCNFYKFHFFKKIFFSIKQTFSHILKPVEV